MPGGRCLLAVVGSDLRRVAALWSPPARRARRPPRRGRCASNRCRTWRREPWADGRTTVGATHCSRCWGSAPAWRWSRRATSRRSPRTATCPGRWPASPAEGPPPGHRRPPPPSPHRSPSSWVRVVVDVSNVVILSGYALTCLPRWSCASAPRGSGDFTGRRCDSLFFRVQRRRRAAGSARRGPRSGDSRHFLLGAGFSLAGR